MNKFTQAAIQETTLSPVMEGREKVPMKVIKERYPEGLTVTEFDFITTNDPKKGPSTFPVLAFAEDPGAVFFGGDILNRICRKWADLYGGDIAAASEALKESGGVKIRLYSSETKAGNSFTAAEIIPD